MNVSSKSIPRFALFIAMCTSVAACNRESDRHEESRDAVDVREEIIAPPPATSAVAAAPTTTTSPESAEDALAQVAAVDSHEVAAAEQARAKQVTGAVLEYANLLHREHATNLEAGKALAAELGARTASSPAADALREKGRAELAALDAKSGKDYEKAYIDAMVKGHTEALALLDDRLVPSAKNEATRNFLTNSRDHVAMHLERAKELQGTAAR